LIRGLSSCGLTVVVGLFAIGRGPLSGLCAVAAVVEGVGAISTTVVPVGCGVPAVREASIAVAGKAAGEVVPLGTDHVAGGSELVELGLRAAFGCLLFPLGKPLIGAQQSRPGFPQPS
jgi:hypothetical protein